MTRMQHSHALPNQLQMVLCRKGGLPPPAALAHAEDEGRQQLLREEHEARLGQLLSLAVPIAVLAFLCASAWHCLCHSRLAVLQCAGASLVSHPNHIRPLDGC